MKSRSLALALSFLLTACGYSPILRHTLAGDANFLSQATASPCLFKLEKENLCAGLEWVRLPEDDPNQEGEFTLSFWDLSLGDTPNGQFIDPSRTVAVKLWMAGMNHGSTRVTVVPKTDASGARLVGQFQASPIHFVMGGEWEIWVQLKNGPSVVDQAKIDVEVAH